MNKYKMFLEHCFDIGSFLQELETSGAVSLPMLTENFRQQLEAEAIKLKAWAKTEGSGVCTFMQFSPTSLYTSLKREFMNSRIKAANITDPNQMILKKYYPVSLMNPHKDSPFVKGVVYNFQISGSASFYLCDPDGTNRHNIDTTPGNLIVFPGHNLVGKKGIIEPPYHGVDNVTADRYSLLLFNCI
ncbi:MAG TPA: hypothetical protein VI968_01240 [archaeon]|nr:hypothetical protein [archaeon]